MLASFRSLRSSHLWRVVSIACAIVMISYICFEVLDLDGSNFQTRYPLENGITVADLETIVVKPYLTRIAEPWTEVSTWLLTDPVDWVHPRLIKELTASRFNFPQHRGYRTALPRSAVPDHLSLHA